MKQPDKSPNTREQRLDQYLTLLSEAVDHPRRAKALQDYCTGLMLPIERKSIEPIAAQVSPGRTKAKHQALQQFIADAPWRDEAVLRVARDFTLPIFERHGGVKASIIDDTGIPKKGNSSVGVSRQYCGQLGQVTNCQVAISLSVANHWMSLPIAYDLYLPKNWINDPERRKKAGVPQEIEFRTKPRIALSQIERAVNTGLDLGVICADAAFGDDTAFRDRLSDLKLRYCVGIRETTTVWEPGKEPLPPTRQGSRGPAPSRLQRDKDHWPVSVKELALGLPKTSYRKVTWREGAKGKLSSRFAVVAVRPAHRDYLRSEPRSKEWLIIEWPKNESEPKKYWLSTLPKRTSKKTLVYFAKLRWRIERDYEELKQETGLGHYEGRKWRGFHHHATMCIAVYAFLMAERGLFPPQVVGGQSGFKELKISGYFRSKRSSSASRAPQSDLNCNFAQRDIRDECEKTSTLPFLSKKLRAIDYLKNTILPMFT